MSTPPQNNGSDNPPLGPPGLTREKLLRVWINKRMRLANTIRAQHEHIAGLHGGGGIDLSQATAAVPPLAHQVAPAAHDAPAQAVPLQMLPPSTFHESLSQIHTYFREQQLAAINSSQVSTTVPNDIIAQQPLHVLRQSLAVQAQASQLQGQSAAMSYHAFARTQVSEIDDKPNENEGATKPPPLESPPLESPPPQSPPPQSYPDHPPRKSLQEILQETLKKKITQKIQEKLKELKPEITATEQALAMEHLLQFKEPQIPRRTQISQQSMDIASKERQEPGHDERQQVRDPLRRVDAAGRTLPEHAVVRYVKSNVRKVQRMPSSQQHEGAPVIRADSQGVIGNNKSFDGLHGNKEGDVARPTADANKMNKRKRPLTDGSDEGTPSNRVAVDDAKAMKKPQAESISTSLPNTSGTGTESTPARIIDLSRDFDESPAKDKSPEKKIKKLTCAEGKKQLDDIINSHETKIKKVTSAGGKKQEKATGVLSKLDNIINSLQDEDVRSAVIEDRANNQAKRKEMQQIYETQVKEMESRLRMYTKLEGLAKQIAGTRTESKAKNSRSNNSKHDGALDMIHLSLKNYRMLEDTSDSLLGNFGKK